MKRISFGVGVLVLESLVGLHRTVQLQLLQCYRLGNRFGLQWHPTPVFLPGESQGSGSLVCCSPWGRKEFDTTERLHFHYSLSCIGEGNGNPLQCSCLENPRDGGAWRAAIYGVTQSRTRLKQLSKQQQSSFPASDNLEFHH